MRFTTALLGLAFGLIQSSDSFAPHALRPHNKVVGGLGIATNPNDVDAGVVSSIPQETTVAAVPKVAQRWRKSTKQLITLGPASSSREMIEKLFLAGADLFRLNFSHGSQEQKKELLMTIREVEEKYAHPIGILGDLQGPKLRVRCS